MEPSLNDPLKTLRLASVIGRMRGLPAEACKSDAKTVMSSAILKMSVRRCAQRILNWWCVDSRMPEIDLSDADHDLYERVMLTAISGYIALEITWDEELNDVYARARARCDANAC